MYHLLNLFSLYAFSVKLNKIKNPHSSIRVNEYLKTQGWIGKSIMHLLAVLFHYLVINVQKQYCNWRLRGNAEALCTEIFFSFWLGSPVIILGENKMSWSNEQKELYGIESKSNNRKYYHFWQEGQMKWENHFLPGDKIPIESQS